MVLDDHGDGRFLFLESKVYVAVEQREGSFLSETGKPYGRQIPILTFMPEKFTHAACLSLDLQPASIPILQGVSVHGREQCCGRFCVKSTLRGEGKRFEEL